MEAAADTNADLTPLAGNGGAHARSGSISLSVSIVTIFELVRRTHPAYRKHRLATAVAQWLKIHCHVVDIGWVLQPMKGQ